LQKIWDFLEFLLEFAMDSILFEDMFEIKAVDREGKKFDKVSRIEGVGETYEMDLILDVNTDIYPLAEGNKVTLALASTLNLQGKPEGDSYEPSDEPSLADRYEYVMFGKVYKFDRDGDKKDAPKKNPNAKVSVYMSYGGLLMMLRGDPKNLLRIELDSRLYLLLRKV